MNAKVNISNRAGASFPVRRMNFNFDDVPEYWMNGSAGLTHFMTALSALFPDGEKLFIDSVRAVRYHPSIKDNEALQKEISAFIGQEAMHTHEHAGFNASAQKYGHNVAKYERQTGVVIQTARKLFAKVVKPFGMTQEMVDLTATTALEHFTATIASQLLVNNHIQELMTDSTMSRKNSLGVLYSGVRMLNLTLRSNLAFFCAASVSSLYIKRFELSSSAFCLARYSFALRREPPRPSFRRF